MKKIKKITPLSGFTIEVELDDKTKHRIGDFKNVTQRHHAKALAELIANEAEKNGITFFTLELILNGLVKILKKSSLEKEE